MPETAPAPVTKGVKTSEYWLTVLATIIGLLFAGGIFAPESTVAKIAGLAAAVLSTLGYTYVRGSVKSAAVTPPAPGP